MARRVAQGLFALVAAFGLAVVLWQVSKAETWQLFGELVYRVETDRPVVALTFDDGPSRKHTAAVVETLDQLDIRASFFLTGHEAARSPELVTLIADAGHEIGNHSFSHDRMVLMPASRVRREIDDTEGVLRSAGYEGPMLFRPPYGAKLFVLPWVLSLRQQASIMWDVDGDDQSEFAGNPQALAQHVVETAEPGSIILMHVMYDSRETSRAALPMIADGLRSRGFEFATISELLELSGS